HCCRGGTSLERLRRWREGRLWVDHERVVVDRPERLLQEPRGPAEFLRGRPVGRLLVRRQDDGEVVVRAGRAAREGQPDAAVGVGLGEDAEYAHGSTSGSGQGRWHFTPAGGPGESGPAALLEGVFPDTIPRHAAPEKPAQPASRLLGRA